MGCSVLGAARRLPRLTPLLRPLYPNGVSQEGMWPAVTK